MISWPAFTGKQVIDLKLDRTGKLLERLGNPHNKLQNVIHVAGTNGKGSTISFLRSFINAAGYNTNVYTSPHLVKFNERIVTQNQEISDQNLEKILIECQEASANPFEIKPTFFEGTTVAALLAFATYQADYNLIETGLGGRLDATNIFTSKLAAIITPIDLDHTELLGDNLTKIALEKIAISPAAKHIIISKQQPEALKAIKLYLKQNQKHGARFCGEDYDFYTDQDNFIYAEADFSLTIPLKDIPLIGEHQYINLATAIATLYAISENKAEIANAIKAGISKTYWPARIEKISTGKFPALVNNDSEIYLDGGHNLHAATAIANWLKTQSKYKEIKLLFTMASDKDAESFLKVISPYITHIYSYNFSHEREFHNHDSITKISKDLELPCSILPSLENFFKAEPTDKTLYFICGSLFLAGEFLRQNLCND